MVRQVHQPSSGITINIKHRETDKDYDYQPSTVSGAGQSKRPPMTPFSGANNNTGLNTLLPWL
jgi:hypothetical protein